jgi:hypothetical protein
MRRGFVIIGCLAAVLIVCGSAVASAATRWAIQTTPNPSGGMFPSLNDVSCPSASSCTAVGTYTASSGVTRTLAERWNGATWSIQTTPIPSGATLAIFNGVSCTSASSCTAVGRYNTSAGQLALAERWNGGTWTVQATPSGLTNAELVGVSCISATNCTATGDSNAGTLAEHWNGMTWSIQTTPNPSGTTSFPDLASVSCASATSCTAVGQYIPGFSTIMLAEHWNGTRWAIQATPSPSGAASSQLAGVSCTSASTCTATGFYSSSSGTLLALAERWNGTAWSVQTVPDPSGSPDAQLSAVSCTSATRCTAAGWYTVSITDGDVLTLAEHWNGTKWAIKRTPNPSGAATSALDGISCTSSATACTAAGLYSTSAGPSFTLAERN